MRGPLIVIGLILADCVTVGPYPLIATSIEALMKAEGCYRIHFYFRGNPLPRQNY